MRSEKTFAFVLGGVIGLIILIGVALIHISRKNKERTDCLKTKQVATTPEGAKIYWLYSECNSLWRGQYFVIDKNGNSTNLQYK